MSMTETAKPLRNNTYVVTSKNGVDEWGLYFEFVELDSTLSNIRFYWRVLVARNVVSYYTRRAETARTTWKSDTYPTPQAARDVAEKMLQQGKRAHVMCGAPLLVQLEPSDVEALNQGKPPSARYRATSRHDEIFGKLEDHMLATPSQFDTSGITIAVANIGITASTPIGAMVAGEPY